MNSDDQNDRRHESSESGFSRRSVLKKAVASSVMVSGYGFVGNTAAQTETQNASPLEIDKLNGRNEDSVQKQAVSEKEVRAIVREVSARGLAPLYQSSVAYEITDHEKDRQFTALTATFSKDNQPDIHFCWTSLGEIPPYACIVEQNATNEWMATTYLYDTSTQTVTEKSPTELDFPGSSGSDGISIQHHGVCGVGKKVNISCVATNLGIMLGVSGACGTCAATGNPFSSACQSCVSAVLAAKPALENLDCNICVPA